MNYWAKLNPSMSVSTHSKEAAYVMGRICKEEYSDLIKMLSKTIGCSYYELINTLCYIASVHDIGKIHPGFQGKDRSTNNLLIENHLNCKDYIIEKYRHESGSEATLSYIWEKDEVFDTYFIDSLSDVILNHHQGTTKGDKSKAYSLYGKDTSFCENKEYWKNEQIIFEKEMRDLYNPIKLNYKKGINMFLISFYFTGLLIQADWIASSIFNGEQDINELAAANKNIDKCINSDIIPVKGFSDLFPYITDKTLRPTQKCIKTNFNKFTSCPNLIIIEDSTGSGKTEAGIYTACQMAEHFNKSSIYFALPTMATANSMWKRFDKMKDIFNTKNIKLMHGLSWMENSNLDEDDIKFFNNNKTALFSKIGVGTVDQVLGAVLQNAYSMVKMCALFNKVLIIDEMHAYDTYMTNTICTLLKYCKNMNVPVIILSATLPKCKKEELLNIYTSKPITINDGYPLITFAFPNEHIKQVVVKKASYKRTYNINYVETEKVSTKMAELGIDFYNKYSGNTCIIANDVTNAQEIYNIVKSKNIPCLLFHSRFTMARRKEIEEKIINMFGKDSTERPDKFILIATQVVEQSLDIDFDHLVTEICPIDLLIQRLGREFRHDKTKRPKNIITPSVDVVAPKVNNIEAYNRDKFVNERIYSPLFIKRTAAILNNKSTISIPEDIVSLINQVYNKNYSEEELDDGIIQDMMDSQKSTISRINTIYAPDEIKKDFEWSYKSYDNEEEQFILEYKPSRLSETTIKIAVVPQSIIDKLKASEKHITKEFAKDCMNFVVNTSISQTNKINKKTPDYVGVSYLNGIKFFAATNNATEPTQTLISNDIEVNKDLGLIINAR